MSEKKLNKLSKLGGGVIWTNPKEQQLFFRENVPKRLFLFYTVNFYAYY